MTQVRWQSKVLWLSIAAQVISILVLTGVINFEQGQYFNQVVGAVLQLLVLFGIVNNPTDSSGL